MNVLTGNAALAALFGGRLPCNCCGALAEPAELNDAGVCADCAEVSA